MRKRVRFSKQGNMKYIGHLDMQRLIQRVLRKVNVPLAYSQGYNPHPLISFAQPLSLGFTSHSEYMDMVLKEDIDHEKFLEEVNASLPEDVVFTEITTLPEGAKKAMAAVEAACYDIVLEDELPLEKMEEFFKQEEILVEKLTKKKRKKTIDLKPYIIELELKSNKEIRLKCSAGNNNLKPKLLFEALYTYCGETCNFNVVKVDRQDLFTTAEDGQFISLSQVGSEG